MMPETLDVLRSCWLFAELDDEALGKLAGHTDRLTFHTGQYLFHEHTPRESIFVVESGQVSLLHGIGQRPVTVAIVGPGGLLGERLLLGDPTHLLSAQANTEVATYRIPKSALDALAQSDKHLYETLVRSAAQRLSDRLKVGQLADEPARSATDHYRVEHDLLGERQVPAEALYGVQTLRATENFPITGTPIGAYPYLVEALACIKQAAARANAELHLLPGHLAQAIDAACEEIRTGRHHDQFVVDAIQGGAGTSTNMNANEVIANRALELLGKARGDYHTLHPLNHVNMSQSTNDVYPTAVKIALTFSVKQLLSAMEELRAEFLKKAAEFKDILKVGRTQLQDAVPMTLGQEFSTYGEMLGEDIQRLREASLLIREINMGATAIGTGITAHPQYAELVCRHLSVITGIPLK